MHGEIELESTLGVGTTAKFWLPFKKVSAQEEGSPLIEMSGIPDRLQSEISTRSGRLLTAPTSRAESLTRSGNRLPSEMLDLSMEERAKIHVLIVEDNQINQQIALKTIKKLGFSVNAVWNGREALDYLLEEPSPAHPRPNIILMDVQMPIMDGYRATHTIRNQYPFKNSVDDIPIVAMTASAIQGDREKCQRAGMDDYLAKPVTGKVLEAMLVKWSIEGGRRNTKDERLQENASMESEYSFEATQDRKDSSAGTSSNQTEKLSPPPPLPPPSKLAQTQVIPSIQQQKTSRPVAHSDLSSRLSRVQYGESNTLASSSETDDQRVFRRLQSEEKASSLRDDKMLNLADNPRHQMHRVSEAEKYQHREDSGATHPLTSGNLGLLRKQQSEGGSSQGDSQSIVHILEAKDRSRSFGEASSPPRRPGLEDTRKHKSERLISRDKDIREE
jgi:CheY-like chemotaxis protein